VGDLLKKGRRVKVLQGGHFEFPMNLVKASSQLHCYIKGHKIVGDLLKKGRRVTVLQGGHFEFPMNSVKASSQLY
jgi:hypothetical protein